MEQQEHDILWMGRENGTTALGKVLTDSDEDKYISNLWYNKSKSKRNKRLCPHEDLFVNVHSGINFNS